MSRTIFDDSHYLNLGALFSFKSISINKSQLRYVSNAILFLSLDKPICQLNCILITSHVLLLLRNVTRTWTTAAWPVRCTLKTLNGDSPRTEERWSVRHPAWALWTWTLAWGCGCCGSTGGGRRPVRWHFSATTRAEWDS